MSNKQKLRMGVEHRIVESRCLGCGCLLDAYTSVAKGDVPTAVPGDISVCMYCGHVMAFAGDLRLRELTETEMVEVAGNEDLVNVRRAVHDLAKAKQDET